MVDGNRIAQNGTLTNRQQRAINGLLYSTSITQASEISGISRRVIHKWLNEDGFKDELARQRQKVRDDSIQHLKILFSRAVDVLTEILEQGLIDYRIRLKACELVLNYNIQVLELGELDSRLKVLESRQ